MSSEVIKCGLLLGDGLGNYQKCAALINSLIVGRYVEVTCVHANSKSKAERFGLGLQDLLNRSSEARDLPPPQPLKIFYDEPHQHDNESLEAMYKELDAASMLILLMPTIPQRDLLPILWRKAVKCDIFPHVLSVNGSTSLEDMAFLIEHFNKWRESANKEGIKDVKALKGFPTWSILDAAKFETALTELGKAVTELGQVTGVTVCLADYPYRSERAKAAITAGLAEFCSRYEAMEISAEEQMSQNFLHGVQIIRKVFGEIESACGRLAPDGGAAWFTLNTMNGYPINLVFSKPAPHTDFSLQIDVVGDLGGVSLNFEPESNSFRLARDFGTKEHPLLIQPTGIAGTLNCILDRIRTNEKLCAADDPDKMQKLIEISRVLSVAEHWVDNTIVNAFYECHGTPLKFTMSQ